MGKILAIVTNAYPFTEKEIFLDNELPYLLAIFSKILLIPLHFDGEVRSIPNGVEVFSLIAQKNSEKSFLQKLKRGIKVLFCKEFYFEVIKSKSILSPRILRYLLGYFSFTIEGSQILKNLLESKPEFKDALFYSYWMHAHASILARLKKTSYPNLKIISRAHGYDLYEEDYFPFFLPLREYTIEQMNGIFPISENGLNYLKKKFPLYQKKMKFLYLGTVNQPLKEYSIDEDFFSFLSCSSLISLKRVDVIIKAIALTATLHPEIKFSWNHLGGGVLIENLLKLAQDILPKNVSWKIHGALDLTDVYKFYQTHKIDLFLSASETEGIPVSMMEAQSFGVPIIATNVGGVSEIVSEKNGFLISSNPSEKEIALAIDIFLKNRKSLLGKRENAFKNWDKNFNAKKNYTLFVNELSKI